MKPLILSRSAAAVCILLATCAGAQVTTDSLILDLPMDGNALDLSGNANNGTIFNVTNDANRWGVPNTAFRFNGTNSYIEIPASPSMNKIHSANEISVTAWINIHQWYNNWNVFAILERYNPLTDAGWGFEANWAAGGILFLADETDAGNRADCNFSWTFDRWYHVGLTYSRSQSVANFYVDGVNVCSTPYTADIHIADTTTSFAVGRSLAGPDEYSDGLIDELKVYYRVLTPTEVDTAFVTGVRERGLENDLAIYPNPGSSSVTIGNAPLGATLGIMDMTGKLIRGSIVNSEPTVINVADLANGVYNVEVRHHGTRSTRKLIVGR